MSASVASSHPPLWTCRWVPVWCLWQVVQLDHHNSCWNLWAWQAKGERDWAGETCDDSFNHELQIADQSFHLLPRNIHPRCTLNCGCWWPQWPHPWLPLHWQIWMPNSAGWWASIAAECKHWRSGRSSGKILPSMISAAHQIAGSPKSVRSPRGNHCRLCSPHDFGFHPRVDRDK